MERNPHNHIAPAMERAGLPICLEVLLCRAWASTEPLRPARRLNGKELAAGCGYSMVVHPETQQLELGSKSFSFDKVFPEETQQEDVYDAAVKPLGKCRSDSLRRLCGSITAPALPPTAQ